MGAKYIQRFAAPEKVVPLSRERLLEALQVRDADLKTLMVEKGAAYLEARG
jgi:hypothetical protein